MIKVINCICITTDISKNIGELIMKRYIYLAILLGTICQPGFTQVQNGGSPILSPSLGNTILPSATSPRFQPVQPGINPSNSNPYAVSPYNNQQPGLNSPSSLTPLQQQQNQPGYQLQTPY